MAEPTQGAAAAAAPEPIMPFASEAAAVERIVGLLDDKGDEIAAPEAPEAAAEEQEESPEPGDAAPPDGETSGDETDQGDPAAGPIIAAPSSWDEKAKEAFKQLPPHLQQVVADRETARQAELRRGQNEVAETRKAIEAERTKISGENAQALTRLNDFLNAAHQHFQDEFAGIDWDRLAVDDPALWAQKTQAYRSKGAMIAAGIEEAKKLTQQQANERAEAHKAALQREHEALIEKVPAFADGKKAPAIKKRIVEYLRETGFNEQEINGLADHRTMMVIVDALDARALREQRAKTGAKVAAAPPKVAAPTKPVAKTERQAEEAKSLKTQLRRETRTDRQAAILEKFL